MQSACLTWCRVPDWRDRLYQLYDIAPEQLHVAVSVHERFHRFKEVSGVPAIEAAVAELNARLAARGAHLHVTSANGNLAVYSQHRIGCDAVASLCTCSVQASRQRRWCCRVASGAMTQAQRHPLRREARERRKLHTRRCL